MSRKRIISLILTATMLLLQLCSAIPAYAEGEAYTTFGNYTTTTTFDGLNVGTDIFAANTTATSTVAITEEDGNSFLKITKAAGQYPWFAMYMNGNDAGAGDLTVKFDFYAYSGSSKVRVNAYIGGASKVLATLDFGAVKAFAAGATDLTYSAGAWYNFEVTTDKAADSVKIKLKEAGATEWSEATVTSDGIFDGYENVDLSQLRIDTQYSGGYSVAIDNYSHSVIGAEEPDNPDPDEPNPDEPDPDEPDVPVIPENPQDPAEPDDPDTPIPLKALYSEWSLFSETDKFASGSVEQHVFVPSDAARDGSTAEFVEDPTGPGNRVLRLHFGGNGAGSVYVMPYYVGSSDAKGPVKLKFDFFAEQSSYVGIRFLWGSVNCQIIGFWGGAVYRNDATVLTSGGRNVTYSYGKWYNVEVGVNWEKNYIEFKIKERGTDEWTNAYVEDIADFGNLDVNSGLTQIRLGYNRAYSDEKNFYVDNYSHFTDETVRPPYALASVKSGFENSAYLDETINMEYTAPLAANVVSAAKVEVSVEGNIVETPYTLSKDENVLSLKFSDLKPSTTYDIKVSDVIANEIKADDVIYSFTTAPAYMEATKPQITASKITSYIKSYLVVSASCCMQSFTCITNSFGKLRFNKHMDILSIHIKR